MIRKISLPWRLQFLLVPVVVLAGVSVLFLISFKTGISRVTSLRTLLKETAQKENILKQKKEVLLSLGSEIPLQAKKIAAVFPDKNSSLLMLSQLKLEAIEEGLAFSSFKVGAEVKEKTSFSRVNIAFTVEGEVGNLISFLDSLKQVAPFSLIDRLDLRLSGTLATADVQLSTYWAPFPEKLEALTEAVKGLTPEERETLLSVLDFKLPVFIQLSPSVPGERDDPFR
jgi:hypothetical protein